MRLSWPTALVLCVALVVFGALVLVEADTSDLMTVILILLGVGGAGAVAKIGAQTNGNNAALMELIRQDRDDRMAMVRALAAAQPVDVEKRPAEIDSEPRSQGTVGDPMHESRE